MGLWSVWPLALFWLKLPYNFEHSFIYTQNPPTYPHFSTSIPHGYPPTYPPKMWISRWICIFYWILLKYIHQLESVWIIMIKNLFEPGICILWAILAVVCLGYSLIVLSVRSGTFSFAIWIGWGILFSTFYCLAHFNIWRRIPLYLQTGIVIFFAFIFIVFTIFIYQL